VPWDAKNQAAVNCGWSFPTAWRTCSRWCRRIPRRVSVDHYRRRLRDKRVTERWPLVTIVDP
jgi:hypothetical protein